MILDKLGRWINHCLIACNTIQAINSIKEITVPKKTPRGCLHVYILFMSLLYNISCFYNWKSGYLHLFFHHPSFEARASHYYPPSTDYPSPSSPHCAFGDFLCTETESRRITQTFNHPLPTNQHHDHHHQLGCLIVRPQPIPSQPLRFPLQILHSRLKH